MATTAPTTDPVCGMTVHAPAATLQATHAGRSYAFCSAACRDRFTADPDSYVHSNGETGA